jgi:hypothetical protein
VKSLMQKGSARRGHGDERNPDARLRLTQQFAAPLRDLVYLTGRGLRGVVLTWSAG